jgi:hypothetical protein
MARIGDELNRLRAAELIRELDAESRRSLRAAIQELDYTFKIGSRVSVARYYLNILGIDGEVV